VENKILLNVKFYFMLSVLTFFLWGKCCDLQGEFYRLCIVNDLIVIKGSLVVNMKKSVANPLLECKLTKPLFDAVF